MPDRRADLFETELLAARRDRAVALGFCGGADVLHRDVAASLSERLSLVNRAFSDVVIIGSGGGVYASELADRLGSASLHQIEPSPAMAKCAGLSDTAPLDPLPLEPGSFDLIVSGLWIHWSNDPLGQLIQMRRALRPDGLMLCALFGGQTLQELRVSFAEAEAEIVGGLSPRVAPMAEIRDLGGLLQRAGFAMPVADSERLQLSYETPLHLMRELRAMGETNILSDRLRGMMRRDVLSKACDVYAQNFPVQGDRVGATFEVVHLSGWAPAPDQPIAKRPGSAQARLADALGTDEMPTGEKGRPFGIPPKD